MFTIIKDRLGGSQRSVKLGVDWVGEMVVPAHAWLVTMHPTCHL